MTCIQRKIKKKRYTTRNGCTFVNRSVYFGPENGYNHAEILTPSTDSSQYSFVLEKDFEQYF